MLRQFLKDGYLGKSTPITVMHDEGDPADMGAGAAEPKMVDFKDPQTGQMIKIPENMSALLGNIIAKTRKETEGKYKPTIEALEKEAAEGSLSKVELEKLQLEAMSAEERAQANARKVIGEHEKIAKTATEEAQNWRTRFESSTLKTDIMSSFGDSKLCNPEQAAILFQIEGGAKISEVVDGEGKLTGNFETRVMLSLEGTDGKPEAVEGTPKELFKRWIQLERNSHHLMNTAPAGSGSRSGGGGNRGGMSEAEMMKLNPTERMQHARDQAKKQ